VLKRAGVESTGGEQRMLCLDGVEDHICEDAVYIVILRGQARGRIAQTGSAIPGDNAKKTL
jgi:hypothetical protein